MRVCAGRGGSEMTRAERAEELFFEGYTCAQSVVLAFADVTGVDEGVLRRLSAPFGGGMGRLREVCGAVSGMVMLLGLSRDWDTLDKEEKETLYAKEREMAEQFRERAGSIVCRDLIAEHPHGDTHNSMKPYCRSLVGLAASIVEESGIFALPERDGAAKEKI